MNRVSASIAHASWSTASRFTASRFTASRLTASRLTAIKSIAFGSTASKYSSNLVRSWSPNMRNYSFKVHLWVHSISASKCISQLAQLQPPSVSLSWPVLSAFKGISKLARSRTPSASLSSLHLSLQVHLQTHSNTASKYIFKKRLWVYRDTAVTEVDRVTGSIHLKDCKVHRHHLIYILS